MLGIQRREIEPDLTAEHVALNRGDDALAHGIDWSKSCSPKVEIARNGDDADQRERQQQHISAFLSRKICLTAGSSIHAERAIGARPW